MISLCYTHFNRFEMLIESFVQVIDDSRISEIIISDDVSTDGSYVRLQEYFQGHEKVKLFQNFTNVGMSLNKKIAIQHASNNTCILFDSDNVISTSYIDALFNDGIIHPMIINVPSFASPNFDFREYEGHIIRAKEAKIFMNDSMFRCLLNCCNYVVQRSEYIKVYRYDESVKEADTIFFNYRWLESGRSFYVVKGMEYFHRVHKESGFLRNMDYNMNHAKEFENKILQL